MAAPAAVLSILVKANTGPATTGLMRINAQLDSTDKKAQSVAKSISKVALVTGALGGAAVAGGLVYAAKKAADFEEQMSSLGAVSEASGKQMERFRKQALKAGADTKFSALEAAAAQTELAKGGLSVQQIMRGGLRSALALAAAGEMELADAAEATVNAMKLFGLRGRDAMKVADGFATAANKTTADVSDFAVALKQGGSAAKAAGLNFVETVSILEALAESGIKGSDAGTSMKAALTQLAAPTAKQRELAKKLNLEFFDQQGNMKSITDISRMLGDRLDGLTKKQQLQAIKTLAGTDGMRALLAVYDAGPAKMAKFQRELGKEGTAADVAKKKQDNLKGSLEQLGGSIETLGIQVGTMMIPAIRRGADELTVLANKIGRIAGRDDLDLGEKLSRSFEVAKVELEPWIRKLGAALEEADIPERLGRAFSAAVPVIAEAMAKGAPVVVAAFVKGFLASDVWGRLALSGWLLMRMGGPPAFMKAGATAGAAVGTGMATGVAASSLRGRMMNLFRAWGPALGVALAVSVGPSLVKKLQDLGAVGAFSSGKGEGPTSAAKQAQDIVNAAVGKGRKGIEEANRALNKFTEDWGRLRDTPGVSAKFRANADAIIKAINSTGAPIRNRIKDFQAAEARAEQMGENISRAMRRMRGNTRESFDRMVDLVSQGTRKMLRTGGRNSERTREAIHDQFELAARQVQRAMDKKVISVEEGSARLRELARRELKLYGISAGRVDVVLARGVGDQGRRPHQRGAYINEGSPSGDSVPAVLERGEYVLNRNAVKKVGRHALDRLNYSMAPRFQGGGIVELLHPGNDPAGHGDHLHVAMATYKAIVALGKRLQGLGWLVGEHPAFGGVGGGHSPTGYHPKGLAIDVNWPLPAEERAKIAALLPMLGSAGLGRTFDGLPKPQIRGPRSVALDAAQGVLDRVHAQANAQIERIVTPQEGAEIGNFQGPWTQVMARIAQSKGWSLADWRTLVMKESGGNPAARNPSSGAYGLGQFLGSTATAYAKYGALSPDGTDQIQAMAQYIADRYGNPSAALGFHNRNNWYAAGGLVGRVKGTLKKVRGTAGMKKVKAAKIRKATTGRLIDRIRSTGSLPPAMARNLKDYSNTAAVAGDMADRAGILTTDNVLGETVPGVVNGKTQVDYLVEQLEALFKWRNELIAAHDAVMRRREKITKALLFAVARRKALKTAIAKAEANQKELSRHPKRNRERLKANRAALAVMRPQFNTLDGRVIPALTNNRERLNTLRGDTLSNLETVQGIGSPMTRMTTLPALGVIGGQILQVQTALRDLRAPKPNVTDTTDRPGIDEALQLVRDANLRTAVSQAQYKVFQEMPSFGGGGVVPGPYGAPRVIEAHGGEGVFTPDQMAAIGAPSVTINVAPGMEWLRQFIDVRVEHKTRRDSRNAARGLPSRGGG